MFVRLSKTLGPGLAQVFSSAPSMGALKAGLVDPQGLTEGLVKVLEAADDALVTSLFSTFGKASRYVKEDGKRPVMHDDIQDAVFTGQLLLAFKWLAKCVEVNYSDFFSVLSAESADAPEGPEASEE